MKIDQTTIFKRIVVSSPSSSTNETIVGTFTIKKGEGDLKNQIFVCGTAFVYNEKGVLHEIEVVYPYEHVKTLILSFKEKEKDKEDLL